MLEHNSLEHRGCQFSFKVRGAGPPVLFIQGVATRGDGWQPQVDGLADRYRCLSFDNRGMGRSQPTGLPLTIEQMTEDARVLMDGQGWESAHVVGHSMGGLIAQHLALTERRRIRSLSLLCTFARGRDVTRLTPWLLWAGLRMSIGTKKMRRRGFLRVVMPRDALQHADQDVMAERLAGLFGHDLAEQPPIVKQQLAALKVYDSTPRLGELAGIPTLVVSARHDRIAPPRAGQILARGIPGAHYIELSDASHGAPIQIASRINTLLMEHFKRADGEIDRNFPSPG